MTPQSLHSTLFFNTGKTLHEIRQGKRMYRGAGVPPARREAVPASPAVPNG